MTTETNTNTPTEPPFGSHEWVIRALNRKFLGTPDRPAATLNTMSEYLSLRKLRKMLWKPETPGTEFIWLDPEDFD
jgi:hypothetical protein